MLSATYVTEWMAAANNEMRGVFTVDWNQPAPDGSGKPLIANEVVHALVQHFDEHDLSNRNVPADVLGRAYEYLIKKFADDAGAKAGEFFMATFCRTMTPAAMTHSPCCTIWLGVVKTMSGSDGGWVDVARGWANPRRPSKSTTFYPSRADGLRMSWANGWA